MCATAVGMVDWATHIRSSGTTYQLNSCVPKLTPGPYDGHAGRTFQSTLEVDASDGSGPFENSTPVPQGNS